MAPSGGGWQEGGALSHQWNRPGLGQRERKLVTQGCPLGVREGALEGPTAPGNHPMRAWGGLQILRSLVPIPQGGGRESESPPPPTQEGPLHWDWKNGSGFAGWGAELAALGLLGRLREA